MRDVSELIRQTKSVVFVNPDAGAGRAGRSLRKVRGAFQRLEMAAEFVIAASVAEMEERVRKVLADGARVVFAMGGDGTVQAVVNAIGVQRFRGKEVVLGILPCGGGNDFASALGWSRRAEAVVEGLRGATIRCVDVLRARTGDGAERLFVGGGGVGLDVETSRHAAGAYRRWPGRARYLASALRAWSAFEAMDVSVEFPDDDIAAIKGRAMLAAVLNTPSYGAGLRVAPEARVDDGLLDVAIVERLSAVQVAGALPRLIASGELPELYFTRRKARSVVLRGDRACNFHGDGEIFGPAPVRIEVVPKAIRVIATVGD